MQTVLITGCSSGFGLETARYFLDHGWAVVATMRQPREDLLPPSDRLRVLELDVTDPASIERVVAQAGPLDVLVNNAGIGWLNALEGTPMAAARELFETNTLGLMAMTQAVLPQMRERRGGVIVNVSSSVTLRALPLPVGLHGEQGRGERVHRGARAGAGAVRHPRAGGAARTRAGHQLRRQCPGADGAGFPEGLCRDGAAGVRRNAGGRASHALRPT